jgi:hypothetical protein
VAKQEGGNFSQINDSSQSATTVATVSQQQYRRRKRIGVVVDVLCQSEMQPRQDASLGMKDKLIEVCREGSGLILHHHMQCRKMKDV